MGRTFAGGTDNVNFGHSADYDYLSELSVGAWLKIPSSGGGTFLQHGYIGSTEAENTTVSLSVTGMSGHWNIAYFHEYGAGLQMSQTFTTNIPNDVWTYVGMSRNLGGGFNVTLYVSSGNTLSTAGTINYTDIATGGTSSSVILTIGNVAPAGSSGPLSAAPFVGSISNVYYYGRALTFSEHQDLANCAVSQVALIVWTRLGMSPEPNISPALTSPTSGTVTGTTVSADDPTCPVAYEPADAGFSSCPGALTPTGDTLPDGADIPFPAQWPIPTTFTYSREADMPNITMVRNNVYSFDTEVLLGADATPVDLTAGTLLMTAKYNYDDADADAVFQLSVGDGITVLVAADGTFRVRILPANTVNLPPHQTLLYYDIKLVTGGEPYTILRGTLNVLPEVTISVI